MIEVCNYLKLAGFKISYVKPLQNGVIDPDDIAKLITSETILVSVQHVNNEIGAIQCIEEVGKITAQNNILFHVDGAQSCGKLPINAIKSNIDLLSISSHKMYGPMGIGVFWGKEEHLNLMDPYFFGGEMIKEVFLDRFSLNSIPFKIKLKNIFASFSLIAKRIEKL